jgi:hypothetical protein
MDLIGQRSDLNAHKQWLVSQLVPEPIAGHEERMSIHFRLMFGAMLGDAWSFYYLARIFDLITPVEEEYDPILPLAAKFFYQQAMILTEDPVLKSQLENDVVKARQILKDGLSNPKYAGHCARELGILEEDEEERRKYLLYAVDKGYYAASCDLASIPSEDFFSRLKQATDKGVPKAFYTIGLVLHRDPQDKEEVARLGLPTDENWYFDKAGEQGYLDGWKIIANEALKKGDWRTTLEYYDKLLAKGYHYVAHHAGDLLRTRDPKRAKLYYMQAGPLLAAEPLLSMGCMTPEQFQKEDTAYKLHFEEIYYTLQERYANER